MQYVVKWKSDGSYLLHVSERIVQWTDRQSSALRFVSREQAASLAAGWPTWAVRVVRLVPRKRAAPILVEREERIRDGILRRVAWQIVELLGQRRPAAAEAIHVAEQALCLTAPPEGKPAARKLIADVVATLAGVAS